MHTRLVDKFHKNAGAYQLHKVSGVWWLKALQDKKSIAVTYTSDQ